MKFVVVFLHLLVKPHAVNQVPHIGATLPDVGATRAYANATLTFQYLQLLLQPVNLFLNNRCQSTTFPSQPFLLLLISCPTTVAKEINVSHAWHVRTFCFS